MFMWRIDKNMSSKNYEKKKQSMLVIISLILLTVHIPQTVQASAFAMESWSDATVCRLVGEQHNLTDSVQFKAEASRRKLNCLNKKILSKDDGVIEGLTEDTSSIEQISKLVAPVTPSDDDLDDTLSVQPTNPTNTSVNTNSEIKNYEPVIGNLKPPLGEQINKDITEELRPNISNTSITDSSTKEKNPSLYSWFSVMIALLALCFYYVSHRQKISNNEPLPTNEYQALDKVVELSKIKDDLMSSVNRLESKVL